MLALQRLAAPSVLLVVTATCCALNRNAGWQADSPRVFGWWLLLNALVVAFGMALFARGLGFLIHRTLPRGDRFWGRTVSSLLSLAPLPLWTAWHLTAGSGFLERAGLLTRIAGAFLGIPGSAR